MVAAHLGVCGDGARGRMTEPSTHPLDALAEASAWRRGVLGHTLSRRQRRVIAKWRTARPKRFVLNWSRRGGKTRALVTLAIEECLRARRTITYAAPTQNDARDIAENEVTALLEGPRGARIPYRYNVQRLRWTFANGSYIQLAGCDGANRNRLRGRTRDIIIIDEAAFVDDLTYIVESILEPQLITTDGVLIMSSTPPESPEHPFRAYTTAAKSEGAHAYDECTLDEVEHITDEQRESAIAKAGGRGSTTVMREYFCQFVTEERRALVPEFVAHRDAIVREVERPRHFDAYTVADTGFNDLSVVGFGYYHFGLGALVIEDELAMRHASGGAVGRAVLAKERELWGEQRPLRRWADASPQTIADMSDGSATRDADGQVLEDGVAFAAAEKQDSVAAHQRLRTAIEQHRVIIHPRCKTTLAHLEYGIWNKAGTDFERIPGAHGHHFDGVAMMKYAVRAVEWGRNPAPILPLHDPHTQRISPHLADEMARERARRMGTGDPFEAAFLGGR